LREKRLKRGSNFTTKIEFLNILLITDKETPQFHINIAEKSLFPAKLFFLNVVRRHWGVFHLFLTVFLLMCLGVMSYAFRLESITIVISMISVQALLGKTA